MKHDEMLPRSLPSRLFRVIETLEEWVLAGGILVIAAVTIANVFFRAVLNSSLSFAEELAQIFIVLVTFAGLGYAASHGRHIRMSALYDQLGHRPRKALMCFIALTTALLMLLLAGFSVVYIHAVRALGTVTPALQVPLWVVYLPVPVGLVLTGIQYLLTLVRNLRDPEVYISYSHKDEYEEAPPPGV